MSKLIERLDAWFKKNRPAYYAIMRPGATQEALMAFEKAIGFTLPPIFKELYSWRNGQRDPNALDENGKADDVERMVFQNHYVFNSLHVVKKNVVMMKKLLDAGEFSKQNWWSVKWVPILTTLGGDDFCLDMGGSFGGKEGQMLYFYHADVYRDIQYPSMDAWLETYVDSLEAGMWKEKKGEFLPKNADKWDEYCKNRFPGYPKSKSAG